MTTLKFRGQIISGSKEYKYIGIQENFNTKGDLVGLNLLKSASPTFEQSFDDWVDDYSELLEYLQEVEWVIKWIPMLTSDHKD